MVFLEIMLLYVVVMEHAHQVIFAIAHMDIVDHNAMLQCVLVKLEQVDAIIAAHVSV
jgi:hypothetical protein